LSTLADDFFVLHVPSEYDNVFESVFKTELISLIKEKITESGRNVPVNFTDNIEYTLKKEGFGGGGKKTIKFVKDASVKAPVMNKGVVKVPQGLPKDSSILFFFLSNFKIITKKKKLKLIFFLKKIKGNVQAQARQVTRAPKSNNNRPPPQQQQYHQPPPQQHQPPPQQFRPPPQQHQPPPQQQQQPAFQPPNRGGFQPPMMRGGMPPRGGGNPQPTQQPPPQSQGPPRGGMPMRGGPPPIG